MHRVVGPISKHATTRPALPRMDAAVAEIGRDLAGRMGAVLDAIPGGPQHRPQQLARTLGVNVVLTSRLLKATQSTDAMAVAHVIPGPEPLRRVLKAAERLEVDADALRAASEAIDRFERLINADAGDRAALDTMISAWLPDVREKLDLASRQAVFKGMSHIRGYAAETGLTCAIIHPAQGPVVEGQACKFDRVTVMGRLGFRKLRAGVRPALSTVSCSSARGPVLTIDGDPVDEGHDIILRDFSSNSLSDSLEIVRENDVIRYVLGGDRVGLRTAVDVAAAEYRPRSMGKSTSKQYSVLFEWIDEPMRRLVFDVLLHKDVHPGVDPQLAIYHAGFNGLPVFLDPRYAPDLVPINASITPLGSGVQRFRVSSIPDYVPMLEHICHKLGWDPNAFRGFRLHVDYPLVGCVHMIGFELPKA
ncbi:MAG: hypothetical protein EA378_03675 [Phycisphaerales bacterium]|nr:MAG: hypothetical protein EA378_03675 [Phycisphaerales bacterium]